MDEHQPVLMAEVREGLAVVADGCYVDATYGRGGHSADLLVQLDRGGRLLALDKDPDAVAHARARFADDARFTIRHAGFEGIGAIVAAWLAEIRAPDQHVDGILFDLGVSSPQLDTPSRGFGFDADGPLDMRMNTQTGRTAAQWLAGAEAAEIARVIGEYGEQPGAHRIASAIVRARDAQPLTRTRQLADVVARAAPRSQRSAQPVARVFQAIRIFINHELEALENALAQSLTLLRDRGRLVVISFHSLEDRIVKRFIARESKGDPVYAGLPEVPPEARPRLIPVGRLVRPTEAEIARNPRARSARLRCAERRIAGIADR
jgi:16S rRNA (cytosine1402-N4)-methyltransferase